MARSGTRSISPRKACGSPSCATRPAKSPCSKWWTRRPRCSRRATPTTTGWSRYRLALAASANSNGGVLDHDHKHPYSPAAPARLAACSPVPRRRSGSRTARARPGDRRRQDTIRRIVSGRWRALPARPGLDAEDRAPVQRFLVQRGDHVKQGQLLAVLESRDLSAAAAGEPRPVRPGGSQLRATTGADVPEQVDKAQTDVDAARETLGGRQEAARQPREAVPAGRAGAQTGGRCAGGVRAGPRRAAHRAGALRALQAVGKQEQIRPRLAGGGGAQPADSPAGQVSYSQILSPISGVVADRPLYAGEMATAGSPLVTVMDISQVVARANVPQNQAASIKVGTARRPSRRSIADEPVRAR